MKKANIDTFEHPPHTRATTHYAIALAIIVFYGAEICPFLDSLTLLQLAAPIVMAFAAMYAARVLLKVLFVRRVEFHRQTIRILALEFSVFLAAGLGLWAYNSTVHGFPMESGLKVLTGLLTVGYFIATDLALEWQRALVAHSCRTGNHLQLSERYLPLSGKLGLFAAFSVLFILAVMFLVINKDLYWFTGIGTKVSYEDARTYILTELAFVAGVILAYVINVIYSYTQNLTGFLDNENGVLERATLGELDGFVPVGTNDEFGLMAVHTNKMVKGLRETTEEIRRTRDVSIMSLASLAETRDNETGAHILRTQRYVKALAEYLQTHPRFSAELSDENIELMYKSAPLHDIGKVGIPDNILLKPGKLTDEEFEVMKDHPGLGAEALAVAEKTLGSNSFLRYAKEISLSHHEKWDGSGYPKGLKGNDIPVSGRLMALADVYDALISKRVYKPAFSHGEASDIIFKGNGTHFDPDVVEAYLAIQDKFEAIAHEFSDQAHEAEQAA